MSAPKLKSFVTEEEAEEQRRLRQLEWERVRKPSDPVEAPVEAYDNRSLFDRLQEQKEKDQQEFESKYALKNQVRGLDEDEARFLDHVSDVQVQMDKDRKKEEDTEIEEYRKAMEEKLKPKEPTVTVLPTKKLVPKPPAKSSQASLLASVVKRKSSGSTSEDKPSAAVTSSDDPPAKLQKLSSTEEAHSSGSDSDSNDYVTGPGAYCAGVLPGIGPYSDSSETDSSDTDELTAKSLTVFSRKVRNGKMEQPKH